MTLYEFVYRLNMILKNNPEYENLKVVYASDEEGNWYSELNAIPTFGIYDEEEAGEFLFENEFEEGEKINAICIN